MQRLNHHSGEALEYLCICELHIFIILLICDWETSELLLLLLLLSQLATFLPHRFSPVYLYFPYPSRWNASLVDVREELIDESLPAV